MTQRVNVIDASGDIPLRIVRSGSRIAVAEGTGAARLCGVADIFNTSRIIVSGSATSNPNDGYWVDAHEGEFAPGAVAEADGKSEIEVLVTNFGSASQLRYFGTSGGDVLRASGRNGGVMVGNDADVDVGVFSPSGSIASPLYRVFLHGGSGNDFLSGRGNAPGVPGESRLPVELRGDAGNDTLVDGLNTSASSDLLDGGVGDDFLYSVDGVRDINVGGDGFDRASVDTADNQNFGLESVQKSTVGRLRMSRATVVAQAGGIAQLELGWTHPKAWRQLRKVEVQIHRGAKRAATITISPRADRIRGQGSLQLVAEDSRVSHRGKTVAAQLALRLPKKLAGETLRVGVEATDRQGHKQLEPQAGFIKVRR